MIYFSKSTKGFYDPSGSVPNDAVEITDEQHQQLIVGNSQGKSIEADADGYPVLVDVAPVELTYAQKRQRKYPPLTDLADALYWQARGDQTKMDDYLAAVESVKLDYPKP